MTQRIMDYKVVGLLMGCFVLGACSKPDHKLIGNWTTHKGDCKSEGEVVIEVYKKVAEVDFMCFAKVCARGTGKIDQAGYLYFSLKNGQSIEGQVSGSMARGSWALEMEGKFCEGTYIANTAG